MRDKALGSLERARSSAGNADVCLLKRRARDPKEDEKEERFCFCAFARVRAPVWKKMKNSKKPSKTLSLSLTVEVCQTLGDLRSPSRGVLV